MEALVIDGGRPLYGEVVISGAKNAALPVLAATMVHGGIYRIHNCPNITDVSLAAEIITTLGGQAERQGKSLLVDTTNACRWQIPAYLMEKMRASVLFLGALLARFGKAELTMPGGCPLGRRPIDLHLECLTKMGVRITHSAVGICCTAPQLHGAEMELPFPSVGATENVMLAAVASSGTVILRGAAREPEVLDLAAFLRAMGAEIHLEDGCLTVQGGRPLHGADHTILPDRIETATYLCAVAGCGGEVCLKHTDGQLLLPVIKTLQAAGCRTQLFPEQIRLQAPGRLRTPGNIDTSPYPGFPTDAQALIMAALLRMEGKSTITEHIFENRFGHGEQMRRLGAEIHIMGTSAVVTGVQELSAAVMEGCDLRAAAALIIAALQAKGKSTIFGLKHLDRGYDTLETNLQQLGAEAVRCRI